MNRSVMLMAQCKREHPDWTPAQHAAWVADEMKKSAPAEHSSYAKDIQMEDGVWRTVNGRRIFIREGEDASAAMERSIKPESARTAQEHRSAMSYHAEMAKRAQQAGDKNAVVRHEKALEAHTDAFEKGGVEKNAHASNRARLKSDSAHFEKGRGSNFSFEEELKLLTNSNVIKGVEIFAAGKHNGDDYTEQDLDDMVAAFGELDYRPALKVGHTKDSPGAPSYGWVTNLRKSGTKLLADLTDMHDSVVKAMRERSYDRFSSEIYFNLKRGGKTFRRALKAVALLGAEVPAVAGLTPLHKMEFAAEGEYDKLFSVEGALEVPAQAMYECLAERMSGIIETFNHEEDHDMKTKAQQLKELNDKLTEINGKLTTLNAGSDADKATQIKSLTEQVAEITKQLSTLAAQKDDPSDVDKAAREAADAEVAKTLKAANDRIAELEADGRRRAVAEKVSTLKVPAFRPALEAVYAYALLHSAEKVKVYSKDKDGKETSADQNLVDIADGLVAGINAQADKLFRAFASVGAVDREQGATDPNPGNELDARVKEHMAKNPTVKDYGIAMDAVLAADPALAKAYREGAPTH